MTSAPNPRQPLSGNKIMWIVLSVVLFSCNAFRMIPDASGEADDNSNPPTPPIVTPVPEKPVEENPPENEVTTLVEFFGEYYQVPAHKNEFKVALILPFHFSGETDIEQRTSDVMLDFYSGVKMALEGLEDRGLKMKLYVYDNQNSPDELKKVLAKKEMTSMDVIVGPIMEDQMAIVSEFGLKHKIPVFSPFSSINSLEQPNKLFYASSPNMRAKAKALTTYMEKNHKNKKLIILRDGKKFEKDFVPVLIEELKLSGKIKYSEQTYTATASWISILHEDSTVIYIPSNQPVVVNSSLGKIFATKKSVIVLGENSWADFEDNDYHFWTKLNVHLLATDFVDEGSEDVKHYREQYRALYKRDPSLYAYIGYDQFNFIGDFLLAFGEHFPAYIRNRKFRYLASSFNFAAKDGYNQNTNFFILRFRDMKLELAQ